MKTVGTAAPVEIQVNGRPHRSAARATIADLVAELAPGSGPVAVERNGAIVRRAAWGDTPLAPGDRIEIVRFVQGG